MIVKLDYNRIASAPLREEVLVAVLISRSPKEVRTYLYVQVREETARLSHVRQLLYEYLRARKAWKAPRTEEFAETNHSNIVPMDVDSLHCKGGKGKKGKGKGRFWRHIIDKHGRRGSTPPYPLAPVAVPKATFSICDESSGQGGRME